MSLPSLQLPVIDPELIRMFPEVTLSAQKPVGFEEDPEDQAFFMQGWNQTSMGNPNLDQAGIVYDPIN